MFFTLLALAQASPVTDASMSLTLYRGAPVYTSSPGPTYQDVEDTSLDRSAPDSVHGGDYTLVGSDGHTILLRFGSLAGVLPHRAHVVDATLVLTSTST